MRSPTWEYEPGPDKEGNDRTTIRFHLVRTGLETVDADTEPAAAPPDIDIEELHRRAYAALKATNSGAPKEARQVGGCAQGESGVETAVTGAGNARSRSITQLGMPIGVSDHVNDRRMFPPWRSPGLDLPPFDRTVRRFSLRL